LKFSVCLPILICLLSHVYAETATVEVSERLAVFGRNELVSVQTPKWKILLSKFQGPMPYMVRMYFILVVFLFAMMF